MKMKKTTTKKKKRETDISVMTSKVRCNDTRVIGRYCNGSHGEVVMARSFPPSEPPPTPPSPPPSSSPSELLHLRLLLPDSYSFSFPPPVRERARGMSRLGLTCPPIIILTRFNLNNAACGFHRHARARLIISRTNSPTRYPSMIYPPPRQPPLYFSPLRPPI